MKQLIIGLWLLLAGVLIWHISKEEPSIEVKVIAIIDTNQPEFLTSEDPQQYLREALEYYNVEHPDIVIAQAILETGHFKSRVCLEDNNLFGLVNPYTGTYFTFNHWAESVEAYKSKVQYKWKEGEDYYQFLDRIGYAEDTTYTSKLKIITKNIQNND